MPPPVHGRWDTLPLVLRWRLLPAAKQFGLENTMTVQIAETMNGPAESGENCSVEVEEK
jgi:hypothetical protein